MSSNRKTMCFTGCGNERVRQATNNIWKISLHIRKSVRGLDQDEDGQARVCLVTHFMPFQSHLQSRNRASKCSLSQYVN